MWREDRKTGWDGSRNRNESTRRGSVGVGSFVGVCVGEAIGTVLANLYPVLRVEAAIGAFVGFSIGARGGGWDER